MKGFEIILLMGPAATATFMAKSHLSSLGLASAKLIGMGFGLGCDGLSLDGASAQILTAREPNGQ